MTSLTKGKGKKGNKRGGEGNANENQIDFQIIKKFNALKLSVPMQSEDYIKTIEQLDQLRDALVYWGKIMQRQTKIKFIRNTIKLVLEDEFIKQAEDDEKFIEQEKEKYQGDDQ